MTGMEERSEPGPGRRRAPLQATRRLPIDCGEVACPQRGVVAAGRCFACAWFVAAELEGIEPAIRCGFWRQLTVDRPGPLGPRLARAWTDRDLPA
ncbi:MAG TPA: hypothetical protein VNO86_03550 [Candidatus Binatia bacterium]|nr:hypothetical protein [Candidatus Binatia bacterium]